MSVTSVSMICWPEDSCPLLFSFPFPYKSVYEKWQWNHASSNKLSCYNGRSVQLERSPVKDEDERNKEDDSIRKNKILPPLQAWDISIDE